MNNRQIRQLEFDASDENIIVGSELDLPLPLEYFTDIEKLKRLGYVEKSYENGLTAYVYKLKINDTFYTLKVKRDRSLVQNVDGQTSFLNEVQRRRDFEELRVNNKVLDKGIVKTIYANYRLGFMLSHWIEGIEPERFSKEMIRNLFKLTWNMEKSGIMEWDLCSGNLLVEDESVTLFDFGYAYRHNPLTEYNSEGKENPLFNSVERFETRAYMPYLLNLSEDVVLKSYRVLKEEAIAIFEEKLEFLKSNNADLDIVNTCQKELNKWKKGILNDKNLKKLYDLESFRSYVLDIHDDISGKSCSPETIKKIEKVIEVITNNHSFLKGNNGYIWDDLGLCKKELLDKYCNLKKLAKSYLI